MSGEPVGADPRDWLLEQLPAHMHASGPHGTDDFLRRFLWIFGEIAGGVRAQIDSFPYLLDLEIASEPIVRFAAAWTGLEVDARMAPEHQRRLATRSGAILKKRGTGPGLAELLRLVTGGAADVSDTGGVYAEGCSTPVDKHVWVELDHAGPVTNEYLVDLIADEIPADCTFELWIDGAEVYSERREGLEEAS